MSLPSDGHWQRAFEAVALEFNSMLNEGEDSGCAFSVYHKGKQALSVWGGYTDPENTLPWQQDTLTCTFSACKPLTAVIILQLVEQGLLELNNPIANYWPAFAANGKAQITTLQVLSHSCGLPAFKQAIADDDLYNWQAMVKHVEQMEPWWPAGTKQGYKPFTFGWILGELIRIITGKMPAQAIRDSICTPLDLDLHIGLSAQDQKRCSSLQKLVTTPAKPKAGKNDNAKKAKPEIDENSLFFKAFNNPKSLTYGSNSSRWRAAEIPAANGHCTADSLACFYSELLQNDCRLLKPASVELFKQAASERTDETIFFPIAFSAGMFLSTETSATKFGKQTGSFGHPGAGGSVAFADPHNDLGVAFVTKNMGVGLMGDKRLQRLSKALYNCL